MVRELFKKLTDCFRWQRACVAGDQGTYHILELARFLDWRIGIHTFEPGLVLLPRKEHAYRSFEYHRFVIPLSWGGMPFAVVRKGTQLVNVRWFRFRPDLEPYWLGDAACEKRYRYLRIDWLKDVKNFAGDEPSPVNEQQEEKPRLITLPSNDAPPSLHKYRLGKYQRYSRNESPEQNIVVWVANWPALLSKQIPVITIDDYLFTNITAIARRPGHGNFPDQFKCRAVSACKLIDA